MTYQNRGLGDLPDNVTGEKHSPEPVGPRFDALKYPRKSKFTNNGFGLTTVSKQVLSSNNKRLYLLVQNNSVADVRIAFGKKADTFSGILIPAGGYYEPYVCPTDAVFALSTAAANIVVVEGIISEN